MNQENIKKSMNIADINFDSLDFETFISNNSDLVENYNVYNFHKLYNSLAFLSVLESGKNGKSVYFSSNTLFNNHFIKSAKLIATTLFDDVDIIDAEYIKFNNGSIISIRPYNDRIIYIPFVNYVILSGKNILDDEEMNNSYSKLLEYENIKTILV